MSKKLCLVLIAMAACTGSKTEAPDAAVVPQGETVLARVERAVGRGTLGEASALGFDAIGERWVPRISDAKASMSFPAHADGAFELRQGTMAVRVALVGARAAGIRVEGDTLSWEDALPGTTLIHRPHGEGTEEFLFVKGAAPSEIRYTVDLEGVTALRLLDGVLEFFDATRRPRLRTYAPIVRDSQGKLVTGTLRVEGCAVDTSGAVPWLRPLVAPGAKTCTLITSFDPTGLVSPLLIDPPWTLTSRMVAARYDHAASAVTVGTGTTSKVCVVVSGGAYRALATDTPTIRGNAELFCPSDSPAVWVTLGPMPGANRHRHVQADLGGGKVLIAGGAKDALSPPTAILTTLILDVNSVPGTYTTGAAMSDAVYDAAIETSPDGTGHVFVTGGFTSLTTTATKKTRIYDIAASTWSLGADMATARAGHGSFATDTGGTKNGRLFAAGGLDGATVFDTVEYLDWKSGTPSWKTLGTKMSGPRKYFAAVANAANKAMLGGGGVAAIDRIDATGPTMAPLSGIVLSPPDRYDLVASYVAGDTGRPDWFVFAGGTAAATSTTGDSVAQAKMVASDGSSEVNVPISVPRRNATMTRVTAPGARARLVMAGGYRITATGDIRYPASEEIFSLADTKTPCAADNECASAYCVDGYCCNTACTGQCEACDGATPGICKNVVGVPHGTRTACKTPRAAPCGFQCDGTSATTCSAASATTECKAATCGTSLFSVYSAAKCDGAGTCGTTTKTDCGKYLCDSTLTTPACRTKCTDNAHCKTGYRCDLTSGSATIQQCVPTGDRGSPCAKVGDCTSPLTCTDGVCCGVSACATGQVCNVAGYEGYCHQPFGSACTGKIQCAGGNCVDGVCCDGACGGTCEQCNASGSVGTCTTVAAGLQPAGGRTKCAGSGACQAVCNGIDPTKCGPLPGADGTKIACASAACTSGVETPTAYCNAGVCETPSPAPCVRYVCGPTACKTSCLTDPDCATGYFCKGGVCESSGASGTVCGDDAECTSKHCVDGVCCTVASCTAPLRCNATTDGTCAKPLGAACAASTECGSKFCADGVCCNAACTGQCEACNVDKGQCVPVAGAPRGTRTACAGTGPCQAACDGTVRTKCGAPPGITTVCLTASCTGSTSSPTSYCDGAGACAKTSTESCAPYICGSTACKGTCTLKADCATGYACVGSTCVTEGDLGTVCTDASQCKSKFCVDAVGAKKVCCEVAVCGGGAFCGDASTPTPGKCVAIGGAPCTAPSDCSTGFCVDGVCCDSLCAGQCQSCAEKGGEGKCVAAIGKPRGSRAPCFDGGGEVCLEASCDGADGTKCVGKAHSVETPCGPATCADGVSTAAPRCDGKGACTKATPTACSGFACAADGTCKTKCASPADCLAGYGCGADGKCSPKTADCSADRTQSKRTDGTTSACAPFLCDLTTGACLKNCATSADCALGASCDGGVCVAQAAAVEDSGGCAMGSQGGSPASLALGALVALGTIGRRRKIPRARISPTA